MVLAPFNNIDQPRYHFSQLTYLNAKCQACTSLKRYHSPNLCFFLSKPCTWEGSNQMPLFVLIAKVCATQAYWKRLLLEDWSGIACRKASQRHWPPSTKSFPTHGLHCVTSSPRPAKEKWRYSTSMWQIVQFNLFIHSLCHKHCSVWLVRKGWARAEGGKPSGHSCLVPTCALWVTWIKSEEKMGDWHLFRVRMQTLSSLNLRAQHRTRHK